MAKKKAPVKEPKWDPTKGPPTKEGHYYGPCTGNGFDFKGGNRFYPSPGNLQVFRAIYDEDSGLRGMQDFVSDYVSRRLALASPRYREFWRRMAEDFGISLDAFDMRMDVTGGFITVTPKFKKEPK